MGAATELAELANHKRHSSFVAMGRRTAPYAWPTKHGINFNINGAIWTYNYKEKRNGRRRARLCLNGANQKPGVDYDDQTFQAALRHSSIRILMAMAIRARLGFNACHHDLVAAFL